MAPAPRLLLLPDLLFPPLLRLRVLPGVRCDLISLALSISAVLLSSSILHLLGKSDAFIVLMDLLLSASTLRILLHNCCLFFTYHLLDRWFSFLGFHGLWEVSFFLSHNKSYEVWARLFQFFFFFGEVFPLLWHYFMSGSFLFNFQLRPDSFGWYGVMVVICRMPYPLSYCYCSFHCWFE